MSEIELVKKIQNKDKSAIKELYLRYSPVMLAICIRYCGNREDAKDVMHETFIKIITNIGKYSGKGNFEGWMKRIMVNSALDFYKKNKKNDFVDVNEFPLGGEVGESEDEDPSIDKKDIDKNPTIDLVIKADFTKQEIIDSLQLIPEIYRIVFCLFVLENYTHIEIAQTLGFDEKVSRTRLFRAKEMIKNVLYQKSIERIAK